jgi:ribonuclease P protein component
MPDCPTQRESFRFPADLRMRCRDDFHKAFRSGARVSDGRLTVWADRNGLEYSRLGIVVGRKYGGAVQRNRIKRLLREAFRLHRGKLPTGLDLVCAPRAGIEISLTDLTKSLLHLAIRLQKQLARRGATA